MFDADPVIFLTAQLLIEGIGQSHRPVLSAGTADRDDELVFPLGSTEQLKLKTLLSEEDFKYITSSDDGAYRFTVTPENNEPIDLSDEIPDLIP